MHAPRFLHRLALALAIVPLVLVAQSPSSSPAATPPAFDCADTTRRVLGFLVGEYDARAVFRSGPAAWDSSGARISVTRELDGCVLAERFVGTRYGAPYAYLAIWSAHGGASAPLQRAFVHSQHGLLGVSAGRALADTMVLEDSAFVRQRWVHQRFLLWRVDGRSGELRSEGRRSEDARATWFVTQRMHYLRRPDTPAAPTSP